jgi:exopolysaccharide production protein ExoY
MAQMSPTVFTAEPTQIKRTIDCAFALILLVLPLPVLVAVYLLVAVFVGLPIIYAHQRVGQGGKVFNCYKFRTMSVMNFDA